MEIDLVLASGHNGISKLDEETKFYSALNYLGKTDVKT